MSNKKNLSASIKIGSVLENSVRRNIGVLKSGLASVGDEIKSVERKQRELGKQRKILERQGQSVEALDRDYEDLGRTLDQLRRKQERLNRAAGASRRVGASFRTMASDITRNSRAIAVGVGLAGGAIFGLASSTAALGDDVAKTSDKLGIEIGALQELRYAAERSGVATSAFDSSLEKLTKNIGLALEGTGAQKDALDALNLSASDLATMSPEAALGAIADRMQGVETQAEKAAIANDLFGRSGIGMLNMLRDGSDGLKDLRDQARRTGYVLSEQAARDAEVFQDTLLDTRLVMVGLKNTVGAELMPVVTQTMRRVGDALLGNREQVQEWAGAFADGVERALPVVGEIVTGLGEVASVSGRVVGKTAEMVGGWENFGVIIGAALASRTLIRIGKFAGSVISLGRAMIALAPALPVVAGGIKAIGLALAANPIGLAVGVIAGGALLIQQNWDTIGPWFKSLWDRVRGIFDHAYTSYIKPVVDKISNVGGITGAWEGVKSGLDLVLTWIGNKFTSVMELIEPVIEALKWTIDKGVGAANAVGNAVGLNRPGSVMDGPIPATPPEASGNPGLDRLRSSLPGQGGAPSLLDMIQTNATGGPYQPGWHLTGEKGPELKFESRAGYVANNRAMRELASYAETVGSAVARSRSDRRIRPDGAGRDDRRRRDGVRAPVVDRSPLIGAVVSRTNAPDPRGSERVQNTGRDDRRRRDGIRAPVADLSPLIGAAVSRANAPDPRGSDGVQNAGRYAESRRNDFRAPIADRAPVAGDVVSRARTPDPAGQDIASSISDYLRDRDDGRQTSGIADRLGAIAPADFVGSTDRDRGSASRSEKSGGGEVTQQITNHFHASGVSAEELIALVERKQRDQARGGLFDRAGGSNLLGGR